MYNKYKASLVDSGALRSCISLKTYEKLPKYKQKLKPTPNLRLCGADQQPLRILGEVDLDLNLRGFLVNYSFAVVADLVNPIIIGADLLSHTKAAIHYGTRTVTFFDNLIEIDMNFKRQTLDGHVLCLAKSLTVPARCAVLASIRVPALYLNQAAVVQPLLMKPSQRYLVGNSLVQPSSRQTVVNILNPFNQTLRLRRNLPIAFIQTVAEIHETSHQPISTSADIASSPIQETENKEQVLKELGIQYGQDSLTTTQHKALQDLLYANRDIFATSLSQLPGTSVVTHEIETTGPASRGRVYRHSPKNQAEIQRQVNEMLQNQIIRPCFSLWSSPVILVSKKDNVAPRFVIDLRALNAQSKQIFFPLPSLESVLDLLADKQPKYFSSLDMTAGYWQIALAPNSQEKTAFVTSSGSYCFQRMPFGLAGASASFQRLMQTVLRAEINDCALAYLDDVLIFSQTFEAHLSHLNQVFSKLRAANLRLNPKKCKITMKEIKYLGHLITQDGLSVDPTKTAKIRDFPTPHSVSTLRQFLGLTNYYRRFIKGYSHLVAPLTQLLHKDTPFVWTEPHEVAFQTLRDELTKLPTLRYAKLDQPFHVHCDASGKAIGYSLTQIDPGTKTHRPLEFGGRNLTPQEQCYSISEKECLALIVAVRNLHPYLVGQKFFVHCDHMALKFLKTIKSRSNSRLSRWSLLLQGYDFEIEYVPGKSHIVPDILSRMDHGPPPPTEPDDVFLNDDVYMAPVHELSKKQMTECEIDYRLPFTCAPVLTNNQQTDDTTSNTGTAECKLFSDSMLKDAQQRCPELAPIIDYLVSDILPDNNSEARRLILTVEQFVIHDGILYHLFQTRAKGADKVNPFIRQLAVPQSLRKEVLQACHDDLGHAGEQRSYLVLRARFYWKNMYSNLMRYVQSCLICQQCKRQTCPPRASLHCLPAPQQVGQRWHVDHAGPLPVSDNGNKYILMFVESLSGYPEMIPVRDTSAKTTADCLFQYIFARHGPPKSLVSDRGAAFLSKVMQELCNRFNIKQLHTSSYHAQTNSRVERQWPMIWAALRAYCEDQNSWEQKLPSISYALRATPSTANGWSPNFIMHGRDLELPLQSALTPSSKGSQGIDAYLSELLPKLEIVRQVALDNIRLAQQTYKHYYDLKDRPVAFNPGDLVWLNVPFTTKGVCTKLRRKFVGPFYIVRKGSNDTYILRECGTNKLQPAPVHVNRLRVHIEGRDFLQERFHDILPDSTLPLPPIDSTNNNAQSNGTATTSQPISAADGDSRTDGNAQTTIDTTVPHTSTDSNTDADQATDLTVKQQANPVPSTSTATNDNDQVADNSSDWYDATKLIASKVRSGKQYYKVSWSDGSAPTWEPAQNVTQALIDAFHVTHTWNGKRRKRT